MRRRAHVDANQPAIVKALTQSGCSVQSLAAVGRGCPDLLVGRGAVNILLEIKNPDRNTKSQRGADKESLGAQQIWRDKWRGQVAVVYTVEQALAVFGIE